MYRFRLFLFVMFSVAFLFLLLSQFIFIRVVGDSMYPTLKEDDTYVTVKAGSLVSFKRGDIVTFEPKEFSDSNYIKRVIGLPNERVDFDKEKDSIFINGMLLTEHYLNNETNILESKTYHLKDDEYLVLGDNREASNDSRHFGIVKRVQLESKVLFKLPL